MNESEPVVASPAPAPSSETEFLLAFLQKHEVVCPLCKYNLRNLTLPRCPECGREIKLTVGVTEPYLLPWIVTTIFVAMAAGVGWGGLFLVGVTSEVLRHGWGAAPALTLRELPTWVAAGYGSLAVPATLALILLRRRFWRIRRQVQIAVAMGAIIADIGILAALVASNS